MRINGVKIHAIGGIRNLELEFRPGLNLLCGPNGVGKTTILECIGHSFFSGRTLLLQRTANQNEGSFAIAFAHEGVTSSRLIERNSFHFSEQMKENVEGQHQFAAHILVLKTNRHFGYQNLQALARDPVRRVDELYNEASSGIDFQNIKNWLAHREMWLYNPRGLSQEHRRNLQLAKQCFSLLDEHVAFDRVEPDTYDILVSTREGSIPLEYLSSGFKSCLCLLLGLMKEIEFRFKNPDTLVEEFRGVVTVDELDLHLHPEWQGKLVSILKRVFPATQFIASTHSPHMIQTAAPNEIIALAHDENGSVIKRSLPTSVGFQGWTVEEILSDVMGMADLRSHRYNELMAAFGAAIDNGDVNAAQQTYETLDSFLHPANELRKLFRFQLAQITSSRND